MENKKDICVQTCEGCVQAIQQYFAFEDISYEPQLLEEILKAIYSVSQTKYQQRNKP